MPKLSVYNISGEITGEIELNEIVFGVEFNEAVVHQAVVMQLANQRQGTSATKTRAMVRGGGTTFGPQPRSYAKKMPRQARRLALRCALSAKVAAGQVVVVEGLTFDAPKTKNVAALLNAFQAADAKALLITAGADKNVELSARNMPKVTTITTMGLNCFDILNSNKVILAKEAVEKIEEVLA